MNNDYLNAARAIKVGNPTGKSVLLLLADLSRGNDGFCWPSEDWIANALELSPSAVRKWLGILVEQGTITKRRLTEAESQRSKLSEPWKRMGYQMNFNPNQGALGFGHTHHVSAPPRGGDRTKSAPPRSGEKPESPPPHSGDKNRQRHLVAESAPPRVTDTSWRHITYIEEFKPEEELKRGRAAPKPGGDPRKNHPAIVAIREISSLYPPKEIWDLLIDTLGEKPHAARLKECWLAWRVRGNKPTNYAWALEWYVQGVPSYAANGNGHKPTAPDPGRPIEAAGEIRDPKPQRPAAHVTPEERNLWTAFLDHVRNQTSADIFQSWFKPLIFDGLDESKTAFRVRARPITHDWVTKYYQQLIYETLVAIGLAEFTIRWEVEKEEYIEVETA